MSAMTKKKYVVSEALQRYELPSEKQYIVKVRFTANQERETREESI